MKLLRKEDNLIMKMIFLLRKRGFQIPDLEISLEKRIPLGSGLGGGSSNAAATLAKLNECFHLNLSYDEMQNLCSQIGSDVSFFLWGGTALGSGRGEIIQPLKSIGDYWVCLAIPGGGSSTKSAYSKASKILTEKKKGINITNFIYSISKGSPDFSLAENDFERLLFKKNKIIARTKELFQKYNSCCTMLSGSGSSVYALFLDRGSAVKAAGAFALSELKDKMTVLLARTVDAKEYHKRLFQVIGK
jgi:4-diphosphocytidyl-2-C-methyl-D-erythritol kinase